MTRIMITPTSGLAAACPDTISDKVRLILVSTRDLLQVRLPLARLAAGIGPNRSQRSPLKRIICDCLIG